jgi:L-alanine-DL-glutamate epimerase-like enolase superfamily enzyme
MRPMVITGVESVALSIPFRTRRRSAISSWSRADAPAVDSLLVHVTTDEGVDGWGEALGLSAVSVTRAAVDVLVAPLCVGKDPTRIAELIGDARAALVGLGPGGPVAHALSAVDIALWDIAGKVAGAPLGRLLLDRDTTTGLRCYASIEAYADSAALCACVREALDAGFTSVKLHETALPGVRAVRETVGREVELALDVNCAWTADGVARMAPELRELDVRWLEEPIWPPDDYEGLAELRRTCAIPIAAGENASTPLEFARLLRCGAVDLIQPSPAKMGGVSGLSAVFALAAEHAVAVVPHTYYDGPGLLAAIQATAALGTVESMIEWRHFDLQARIYGDALRPEGGRIAVPAGPGLGLDPDPAVIAAYRIP